MGNPPTRGRLAEETHSIAMSRVIALAPQRKLILEALDRVSGSAVFQSSKRGREFLRHIVERALAGEFDQLKERCIGSALFGRPNDYDTGSDSVVRVTANDVRKRLASYYDDGHADEAVTFELPVGSYIPEIRLSAVDRHPVAPATVEAAPALPRWRSFPWKSVAISGWIVALMAGILWTRTALSKSESPQSKALSVLPWVALFDGGKTPKLIMPDASMGALREFYPFRASVEDYANQGYLSPPENLPPEYAGPWKNLVVRRHTSTAAARLAAEYSPLAVAAGRPATILGARDVRLSDFHHGDNFILLGSSSADPWVELYEDQMDFVLRYDPGKATKVENRHPRAGDPEGLVSFVPSGTTGEAYAILSLVKGLDGRGRVLIAQGTNMEGTDLAGGLALNPEAMAGHLRACGLDPVNPAGRFEILLRLNATAGSVKSSTVLAVHCTAGK